MRRSTSHGHVYDDDTGRYISDEEEDDSGHYISDEEQDDSGLQNSYKYDDIQSLKINRRFDNDPVPTIQLYDDYDDLVDGGDEYDSQYSEDDARDTLNWRRQHRSPEKRVHSPAQQRDARRTNLRTSGQQDNLANAVTYERDRIPVTTGPRCSPHRQQNSSYILANETQANVKIKHSVKEEHFRDKEQTSSRKIEHSRRDDKPIDSRSLRSSNVKTRQPTKDYDTSRDHQYHTKKQVTDSGIVMTQRKHSGPEHSIKGDCSIETLLKLKEELDREIGRKQKECHRDEASRSHSDHRDTSVSTKEEVLSKEFMEENDLIREYNRRRRNRMSSSEDQRKFDECKEKEQYSILIKGLEQETVSSQKANIGTKQIDIQQQDYRPHEQYSMESGHSSTMSYNVVPPATYHEYQQLSQVPEVTEYYGNTQFSDGSVSDDMDIGSDDIQYETSPSQNEQNQYQPIKSYPDMPIQQQLPSAQSNVHPSSALYHSRQAPVTQQHLPMVEQISPLPVQKYSPVFQQEPAHLQQHRQHQQPHDRNPAIYHQQESVAPQNVMQFQQHKTLASFEAPTQTKPIIHPSISAHVYSETSQVYPISTPAVSTQKVYREPPFYDAEHIEHEVPKATKLEIKNKKPNFIGKRPKIKLPPHILPRPRRSIVGDASIPDPPKPVDVDIFVDSFVDAFQKPSLLPLPLKVPQKLPVKGPLEVDDYSGKKLYKPRKRRAVVGEEEFESPITMPPLLPPNGGFKHPPGTVGQPKLAPYHYSGKIGIKHPPGTIGQPQELYTPESFMKAYTEKKKALSDKKSLKEAVNQKPCKASEDKSQPKKSQHKLDIEKGEKERLDTRTPSLSPIDSSDEDYNSKDAESQENPAQTSTQDLGIPYYYKAVTEALTTKIESQVEDGSKKELVGQLVADLLKTTNIETKILSSLYTQKTSEDDKKQLITERRALSNEVIDVVQREPDTTNEYVKDDSDKESSDGEDMEDFEIMDEEYYDEDEGRVSQDDEYEALSDDSNHDFEPNNQVQSPSYYDDIQSPYSDSSKHHLPEPLNPITNYCEICKEDFEEDSLLSHKKSKSHLIVSGEFFIFNPFLSVKNATKTTKLMCVVCEETVFKYRFSNHQKQKRHKERLRKWKTLRGKVPAEMCYIYKDAT